MFRKGEAHHGPDELSRVPRTDEQVTLTHDYDRIDIFDCAHSICGHNEIGKGRTRISGD